MQHQISGDSCVDVFVANRTQLRRIALKIVRTPDLAEEVLQDAYLRLAEGAALREVHKPLGYCCQVVRHLAFDYHRRRAAEVRIHVDCEDVETLNPIHHEAPEHVLGLRQALAVIDRVLGTLPLRTREAFELNRLSGVTQREVAAQLGCSATLVNFMVKDADVALQSCRYLLKG